MDRHDVSETVTAENVAQLHQEDLKVQHHYGCRGLTYWFDDKRKTAFCLIEAPDANAIREMHNRAHGDVPHSVIEVEYSVVESFLGRITDPEKTPDTTTGLNIIDDPAFRTIMLLTLTHVSPVQNDARQLKSSLDDFIHAVTHILDMHGGSLVRKNGYQYLVSFRSVQNTVQAALAIRLLFKKFDNGAMNDKITLKIGLNAGVPVTEKKSIFEDTIKLAERMCEIVKGEIILSAEVKELYQSENAAAFSEEDEVFSLTPADERFLNLLMEYIEEAWNDTNLKVDDFSKPMGCSKSQLYRKLIGLAGKSPNTFVREYRLRRALQLLGKNEGNISEIAFETGFTSPSYFSKCFQKQYGYSPSAVRV